MILALPLSLLGLMVMAVGLVLSHRRGFAR
jgi:hypothetical protein